MQALTIDYRHDNSSHPTFIKHVEVEKIAAQVRHHLVGPGGEVISSDLLCQIDRLKINGIDFTLETSTDFEVHDDQGNNVFGICEYDPGIPDTAMVCVSPIGDKLNKPLALSTLAHELGHAVFDAPGWIVEGSKGPGLFDAFEPRGKRAYRTTTPDSTHLTTSPCAAQQARISDDVYFAELRANEFMGSLLVPRHLLYAAVEEIAPQYSIRLHRSTSLDPGISGTSLDLTATDAVSMELLERTLATRFGVNPRFIQVRLRRYGMIQPNAAKR